jgi:hypothetical protein
MIIITAKVNIYFLKGQVASLRDAVRVRSNSVVLLKKLNTNR